MARPSPTVSVSVSSSNKNKTSSNSNRNNRSRPKGRRQRKAVSHYTDDNPSTFTTKHSNHKDHDDNDNDNDTTTTCHHHQATTVSGAGRRRRREEQQGNRPSSSTSTTTTTSRSHKPRSRQPQPHNDDDDDSKKHASSGSPTQHSSSIEPPPPPLSPPLVDFGHVLPHSATLVPILSLPLTTATTTTIAAATATTRKEAAAAPVGGGGATAATTFRSEDAIRQRFRSDPAFQTAFGRGLGNPRSVAAPQWEEIGSADFYHPREYIHDATTTCHNTPPEKTNATTAKSVSVPAAKSVSVPAAKSAMASPPPPPPRSYSKKIIPNDAHFVTRAVTCLAMSNHSRTTTTTHHHAATPPPPTTTTTAPPPPPLLPRSSSRNSGGQQYLAVGDTAGFCTIYSLGAKLLPLLILTTSASQRYYDALLSEQQQQPQQQQQRPLQRNNTYVSSTKSLSSQHANALEGLVFSNQNRNICVSTKREIELIDATENVILWTHEYCHLYAAPTILAATADAAGSSSSSSSSSSGNISNRGNNNMGPAMKLDLLLDDTGDDLGCCLASFWCPPKTAAAAAAAAASSSADLSTTAATAHDDDNSFSPLLLLTPNRRTTKLRKRNDPTTTPTTTTTATTTATAVTVTASKVVPHYKTNGTKLSLGLKCAAMFDRLDSNRILMVTLVYNDSSSSSSSSSTNEKETTKASPSPIPPTTTTSIPTQVLYLIHKDTFAVIQRQSIPLKNMGSKTVSTEALSQCPTGKFTLVASVRGIRLFDTSTLNLLSIYGEGVSLHGHSIVWQDCFLIAKPQQQSREEHVRDGAYLERDDELQFRQTQADLQDTQTNSNNDDNDSFWVVGVPHAFRQPHELHDTLHFWEANYALGKLPLFTIAGPPKSGGIVTAVHTTSASAAGSSSCGGRLILSTQKGECVEMVPTIQTDWPGIMYPPGYKVINDNILYIEDEGEVDVEEVLYEEIHEEQEDHPDDIIEDIHMSAADDDLVESLRRSVLEQSANGCQQEVEINVNVLDDDNDNKNLTVFLPCHPEPYLQQELHYYENGGGSEDDSGSGSGSPVKGNKLAKDKNDVFVTNVLSLLPQAQEVNELFKTKEYMLKVKGKTGSDQSNAAALNNTLAAADVAVGSAAPVVRAIRGKRSRLANLEALLKASIDPQLRAFMTSKEKWTDGEGSRLRPDARSDLQPIALARNTGANTAAAVLPDTAVKDGTNCTPLNTEQSVLVEKLQLDNNLALTKVTSEESPGANATVTTSSRETNVPNQGQDANGQKDSFAKVNTVEELVKSSTPPASTTSTIEVEEMPVSFKKRLEQQGAAVKQEIVAAPMRLQPDMEPMTNQKASLSFGQENATDASTTVEENLQMSDKPDSIVSSLESKSKNTPTNVENPVMVEMSTINSCSKSTIDCPTPQGENNKVIGTTNRFSFECNACRGRMVFHTCGARELPIDYEGIARAEKEQKEQEEAEKLKARAEKRRLADQKRRETKRQKKMEAQDEKRRIERERLEMVQQETEEQLQRETAEKERRRVEMWQRLREKQKNEMSIEDEIRHMRTEESSSNDNRVQHREYNGFSSIRDEPKSSGTGPVGSSSFYSTATEGVGNQPVAQYSYAAQETAHDDQSSSYSYANRVQVQQQPASPSNKRYAAAQQHQEEHHPPGFERQRSAPTTSAADALASLAAVCFDASTSSPKQSQPSHSPISYQSSRPQEGTTAMPSDQYQGYQQYPRSDSASAGNQNESQGGYSTSGSYHRQQQQYGGYEESSSYSENHKKHSASNGSYQQHPEGYEGGYQAQHQHHRGSSSWNPHESNDYQREHHKGGYNVPSRYRHSPVPPNHVPPYSHEAPSMPPNRYPEEQYSTYQDQHHAPYPTHSRETVRKPTNSAKYQHPTREKLPLPRPPFPQAYSGLCGNSTNGSSADAPTEQGTTTAEGHKPVAEPASASSCVPQTQTGSQVTPPTLNGDVEGRTKSAETHGNQAKAHSDSQIEQHSSVLASTSTETAVE